MCSCLFNKAGYGVATSQALAGCPHLSQQQQQQQQEEGEEDA
jgi:hypothetical protein